MISQTIITTAVPAKLPHADNFQAGASESTDVTLLCNTRMNTNLQKY
jgi:hypothetical protein